MQKKIIKRRIPITDGLLDSNLHPILNRIYAMRGVRSNDELEQGLERLLSYEGLLGIGAAVDCLVDALQQQKRLLIIGDFDADGATSTAVAVRALRSFGARHVEYLVPNRFTFGYGITPELVEVAKLKKPDVIITVDNGIANLSGVAAAKALNIQVVITDHHLPGETLPVADAIVNPNQPHDLFLSKNIAGVGVIFYVMLALRRRLADLKWFEQQGLVAPVMARLLDLVALGTVADVVPLDHNNRILVHQGLRRIRAKQAVPGIQALLEIGNRDPARLVAGDLGFIVAPRLNAAGRLDDMSLGIECLLCDNLNRAREMAMVLDQLNQERRVIEQDMQEQALHFVKKWQPGQEELPRGVCLFDEDWHQGVIGILASRIKDRLHRPVIAFALANETELKGSARSIAGIHVRDVLALMDAEHPGLINKFGGHAMAAGLTLSRALFDDFAKIFAETIARQTNEDDLQQAFLSDGVLSAQELNLTLAEILREGGPWGHAFPEPLFDGAFQIMEQRIVGSKHLKLMVSHEGKLFDAISFNIDLSQWPNYRCEYANMVYRLDINEFRGVRKVQLIVEYLEAATSS